VRTVNYIIYAGNCWIFYFCWFEKLWKCRIVGFRILYGSLSTNQVVYYGTFPVITSDNQ